MARRRIGTVSEPEAYLKWISSTENDPYRRAALRMLCVIAENPERSNSEVGRLIGRSEKTVRRWWKIYLDQGLTGLLGVEESYLPPSKERKIPEGKGETEPIPFDSFVHFLNNLPLLGTTTDFTESLKRNLERLLPGVDHVSIAFNFGFDLAQAHEYEPIVTVYQYSNQDDVPVVAREYRESYMGLKEIIATLQDSQYSSDAYSYPHGFSYTLDEGPVIGHIILWRRGTEPVDIGTIRWMERLRPFFSFLLTDFIARNAAVAPIESAFRKKYAMLVRDAGLTVTEQQVLVQLLLGRSYIEAASRLHKAPSTVKGQVRRIFQKCGVKNLGHLVKRHFTPFFETLEERTVYRKNPNSGNDTD